MKKMVGFLLGFLLLPGLCWAQNIGPGVPVKNLPGKMASPNFGIGYAFHQAEWEDADFEGHRVYGHFGAVFGDESTPNYEVFLRVGLASLEVDLGNFDGRNYKFKSDTEPMFGVGIKGMFYQGEVFGWGGVLQGLYIDSFKDSITLVDTDLNARARLNLTLEKYWEAELAFPIHARLNKDSLVYFGPMLYGSGADAVANVLVEAGDLALGGNFEDKTDEDKIIGIFAGLALRFENVSFELEAKYKSDLSAGALLTFAF